MDTQTNTDNFMQCVEIFIETDDQVIDILPTYRRIRRTLCLHFVLDISPCSRYHIYCTWYSHVVSGFLQGCIGIISCTIHQRTQVKMNQVQMT